MARSPDLVALSGTRVFVDFPWNTNNTQLVQVLDQQLQSVGWTITTSNASPERVYRSAQSIWWDETATPPGTYSGRIKVHFAPNGASQMGAKGMTDDETVVSTTTTFMSQDTGNNFRLIATPYSMWLYRPAVGSQTCFMAATLHTPKWMQEDDLIESIICGNPNGFRVNGLSSALTAILRNVRGTKKIDTGFVRVRALRSANTGVSSLTMFPNIPDDADFSDDTLWYPIMTSPRVQWSDTNGDDMTIRGWLPDCVAVGQADYDTDSTFKLADNHEFIAFTNTASPGIAFGSLFICKGPPQD